MKDFVTAAKAQLADDDEQSFGFDVPFTVDKGTDKEREMVAVKPSDGQVTIFLAMAGDDLAANTEVMSQSISFLYSLLTPEDKRYLKRRLLDVNDDFGAVEVAEILSYILEEWSGKDSGSRTDSRRSRRPAGTRSTAKQRQSA